MSQSDLSLHEVQGIAKKFADERGWDRFHNPKDVAISLVIEASELLECFQWRTDTSCTLEHMAEERLNSVASELADVILYASTLANALGLDLSDAVQAKVHYNGQRYVPGVAYFDDDA